MNKKIRKYVDIVMYFLMVIMMGYHLTGNKVHEMLGISIFSLFIIHTVLNYKWYKAILKGKYNIKRIIILVINLGLIISFIGIAISVIIVSRNLFYNLNIVRFSNARVIHLVLTSWSYIFMSLHLGLHLQNLLMKINYKYMTIVKGIIILTGLYSFIDTAYFHIFFSNFLC